MITQIALSFVAGFILGSMIIRFWWRRRIQKLLKPHLNKREYHPNY